MHNQPVISPLTNCWPSVLFLFKLIKGTPLIQFSKLPVSVLQRTKKSRSRVLYKDSIIITETVSSEIRSCYMLPLFQKAFKRSGRKLVQAYRGNTRNLLNQSIQNLHLDTLNFWKLYYEVPGPVFQNALFPFLVILSHFRFNSIFPYSIVNTLFNGSANCCLLFPNCYLEFIFIN